MIDWARVLELRDEIGGDDFDEVVALFLSEVEERLEGLNALKPATELCEDFHFLKGSALNLGFADFANLCHTGETETNNEEIMRISGMVHAAYARSKSAFLDNFDIHVRSG